MKTHIAFAVVAAILLQFFPLTKVLSYEFSAVMGVVLGFIGGLVAIRQTSADISFKDVLINIEILFLLPLTISVFNTLVFGVCPLANGLSYYFLITLPALVIGYSLGGIVSALLSKGKVLFFLALFLVILIEPLLEFYFYPQIYTYNFFYGYFPGALYDEYIPITRTFIVYRFAVPIVFSIAAYITMNNHKPDRFIALLLFMVGLTGYFIIKPSIGLATNENILKWKLGAEVSSPNITVVYDVQKVSREKAYLVDFIAEYYYEDITGKLNINLSEPIKVYLFGSNEQKSNLVGARNVDVAKPWRREVFLTFDDFEATLEHELIHAISSQIGVTPLKVADNINFAMIEGFAMALENDYNSNDVHYMAFLADSSGYKVSPQTLFSGFNFLGNTSSISYIYAGSFIKYLADTYGIEKLAKLYGDIDFKKYYDKDIKQLADEYLSFLRKSGFEFNEHKAKLYFGSRSIFKRVCPRDVASRMRLGWEQYNSGAYAEAERTFGALYDYSESPAALWGYLKVLQMKKELEQAIEYLNNEINGFTESSHYYRLQLLLGDIYLGNNNTDLADSIYTKLMDWNPERSYHNLSFIRKLLVSQDPEAAKTYVYGDEFTKLNTLIALNSDSLIYETLPELVSTAVKMNTAYEGMKDYILGRVAAVDRKSSYAAFVLSKFAIYHQDFETAEVLAKLSVSVQQNNNMHLIFEQNYKLARWLNENDENFVKYVNYNTYE